MAARDLINLGLTPDSGTGDTARNGGAKINDLFADIYTNFGDNPIGNDPNGPFYGYRRRFDQFEYKVGELHATGRWQVITYVQDGFTNTWDGNGTINYLDSDNAYLPLKNGAPGLYTNKEWYFTSRGEQIDVVMRNLPSDTANIVLPIAREGDVVRIRNVDNSLHQRSINVWTTPFEFQNAAQYAEWKLNDEWFTSGLYTDSDLLTFVNDPSDSFVYRGHTCVRDDNGTFRNCSYRRVDTSSWGDTPPVDGRDGSKKIPWGAVNVMGNVDEILTPVESRVKINVPNSIYEFVYLGHEQGWTYNLRRLDVVGDQFIAQRDSWVEGDWHQVGTTITAPDGTEIVAGSYILPIAPGTGQAVNISIEGFVNLRIFRQIAAGSNATPVNDGLKTEFLAALGNPSNSTEFDALTTDRDYRYRAVLGDTNDTDFTGLGFESNGDIFKEVFVTTVTDASGNIVLVSDEPFRGQALTFEASTTA